MQRPGVPMQSQNGIVYPQNQIPQRMAPMEMQHGQQQIPPEMMQQRPQKMMMNNYNPQQSHGKPIPPQMIHQMEMNPSQRAQMYQSRNVNPNIGHQPTMQRHPSAPNQIQGQMVYINNQNQQINANPPIQRIQANQYQNMPQGNSPMNIMPNSVGMPQSNHHIRQNYLNPNMGNIMGSGSVPAHQNQQPMSLLQAEINKGPSSAVNIRNFNQMNPSSIPQPQSHQQVQQQNFAHMPGVPLHNVQMPPELSQQSAEYQKLFESIAQSLPKCKLQLERSKIDNAHKLRSTLEKLIELIESKKVVEITVLKRIFNSMPHLIVSFDVSKPIVEFMGQIQKNKWLPVQADVKIGPMDSIRKQTNKLPAIVEELRDDSDKTPYYLRKSLKRKHVDDDTEELISQIKVESKEAQFDRPTGMNLIVGDDGLEKYSIDCDNGRSIVLSAAATKELKSLSFYVEKEDVPVSDHCRLIQIVVAPTYKNIQRLRVMLPIDYPESGAYIFYLPYGKEDGAPIPSKIVNLVENKLALTHNRGNLHTIVSVWDEITLQAIIKDKMALTKNATHFMHLPPKRLPIF
uniref:Mediator complex subunit 15 n=1 Tax=Rhabditophanes sp. KR3021 TaxID=114890 RepID=A0AC35TPE2_9BILA